MRSAGWERYCQRREEVTHRDQALTASPEFAPHMGGSWFLSPDNDAQASSPRPSQEQRQLQDSVQAVPSSNPVQTLAMLEAIKEYGQASAWAALVIDGEELIPAGRSNWLHFVWLSQQKDQQRRVYEHIRGRSQI